MSLGTEEYSFYILQNKDQALNSRYTTYIPSLIFSFLNLRHKIALCTLQGYCVS